MFESVEILVCVHVSTYLCVWVWCAFCCLYPFLRTQLYHITTLCNMRNVSLFLSLFFFFCSFQELWDLTPFRLDFWDVYVWDLCTNQTVWV